MRITNTSMIRNHMYDTQQNLSRMNKINEQINSSKMINRVSDDPHKAIKIMNLNNEIKYTEKYNYNVDETVGWMNNTDSSLEQVGEALNKIKESVLKVGNGTYSENEMKAINAEMNENIKELGEILNTTHGGRYMFGGTNVSEPPVNIIENPDGTVKLQLNPNSNSGNLMADISDGITVDYNVSVNEIFGVDGEDNGFLDTINNLSTQMNEIATGKRTELDTDGNIVMEDGKPKTIDLTQDEISQVKENLLNDTKEGLDDFFNHTVDTRTTFGVRVSTAEKIKELNDENILNMKGVLSLDQDVDQVEKNIELQSALLVYQASIQVGTKLIQPTIMDYLR